MTDWRLLISLVYIASSCLDLTWLVSAGCARGVRVVVVMIFAGFSLEYRGVAVSHTVHPQRLDGEDELVVWVGDHAVVSHRGD